MEDSRCFLLPRNSANVETDSKSEKVRNCERRSKVRRDTISSRTSRRVSDVEQKLTRIWCCDNFVWVSAVKQALVLS